MHTEGSHVQRPTLHRFTPLQYYVYIYHTVSGNLARITQVLPTVFCVSSIHRPTLRAKNKTKISSPRLRQVFKHREKCTIYSTEPSIPFRHLYVSCLGVLTVSFGYRNRRIISITNPPYLPLHLTTFWETR